MLPHSRLEHTPSGHKSEFRTIRRIKNLCGWKLQCMGPLITRGLGDSVHHRLLGPLQIDSWEHGLL